MLELKNGSDFAVVVLHEIYGINRHISDACRKYHAHGYDVYCPNLIDKPEPFDYAQREEAYDFFKNRGYERAYERVGRLTARIRPDYRTVVLLGFSAGATIAWVLSESGPCDGVVAYYGSRIRDNLHVEPKCRSLLIFAEGEPSFDPRNIRRDLEAKAGVTVVVFKGAHGFSDPFSANYGAFSARAAEKLTFDFLKETGQPSRRAENSCTVRDCG